MADNFQAWLKIARKDLMTAKALYESNNHDFWDLVVFQCQQSAEKSVKSYLKFKGIPFPKIHDIKTLGTLIKNPTSEFVAVIFKAHGLTHYVARQRYPSLKEQPLTKIEVEEALLIAEDTYKFFISQINP